MKDINEMVWPIENYTDKIHSGLAVMFITYPWLTFTINQMKDHLIKGFSWLVVSNERQNKLLEKIISTGIRKLIQTGRVQQVTSKTSIEPQWMAFKGVGDSSYTNVTNEEDVATSDIAKKAVSHRSIGARKLWKLNHKT